MINFFKEFDVVVTDRLHGVIFSFLAGCTIRPLNNYNYKIKGVCEWISNDIVNGTDYVTISNEKEKALDKKFKDMGNIILNFIGDYYGKKY